VSSVFSQLDEVLDRLWRLRDELLVNPTVSDRATRLVAVFESEAQTWSQLYELSNLRLVWRSALAAQAGAHANAALWAWRAAAETAGERPGWRPAQAWAAGRVCELRSVALANDGPGGR
jgi:hypothetical protein